ncbi:MAG: tetratricopeptide repeat protein, partial [Candidatus Hodarchaeales archaeon]
KLAQKINSNNLVSIIYNRLGMASAWRLNNLDDGTEYFKRAILFSNKGESHWLKDGPMWNLAAAYQSKKDFTKAINTIQEIAFNARQAGESRTELIATLNLAQLLEEVGNYDEARKTRDAGESLASILGISLNDSYPDNYSSFDEESDSEEDYYTDFESEIDDDNYEDEEELDLSEDDYYPSTLEFKIDLGPEDEDSENIPDEE